MTWWSSVPAPPGLPQRCTEHPRAFPPWCWTNLPRAGRRRPRLRSRTTSVSPRAFPAPSWQSGDKVRWQGYTGTFLRETVDGQAEVLIGTRTCLVPRGELQTL